LRISFALGRDQAWKDPLRFKALVEQHLALLSLITVVMPVAGPLLLLYNCDRRRSGMGETGVFMDSRQQVQPQDLCLPTFFQPMIIMMMTMII
jgi:hypothetical protein